jgi:ATP synthase protein I
MSSDESNAGPDSGRSSPEDDALKRRLADLGKRIDAAAPERRAMSEEEASRRSSALGKAFRLSTELVVGVFGGGAIGWLLDQWLGTSPGFLIGFLLLGVAAGLTNAVRTARQMGAKN